MTRGLVLGKFAPLHRGHQSLIQRSLAQCDETVVLIYEAREVTSIPLAVRAGWIRTLHPGATVMEGNDAPSAEGREPAIMRLQEKYIVENMPGPITHFFSSEWYGAHVAAALGAADVRVDEARRVFPISGTKIRAQPDVYREWVDSIVYQDLKRWNDAGLPLPQAKDVRG